MNDQRSIADLPEELRPYEKCERYGPDMLSDAELLAVILKSGTRHKSVLALAEEILYSRDSKEGLLNLMHFGPEDYKAFRGVGRVKALQLLCLAELCRRISRCRARHSLDIRSPSTVADYYMEQLRHCGREEVHMMMLDNRGGFLRSELVSLGTVNGAAVSSREVFGLALKYGAASILVVHNHPSGRPEPSREDIMTAFSLTESGRMMNIPLQDFMIIGDNCYVSLLESGILDKFQRGGAGDTDDINVSLNDVTVHSAGVRHPPFRRNE